MESERRHELETNSLAVWLYQLPDRLRRHANKILLGVALVAVLLLAWQYRSRAVAERQQLVRENLSSAWNGIRQLSMLAIRDLDGEQFVNLRDSIEREALNGLDQVLVESSSSERRLLASALLAKGQLYWELSRLPPPPGASTRPTLLNTGRSAEENLQLAEDAFQRVLTEFADEYDPKINAEFSLAAIEESRRQFDAARARYRRVIDDGTTLAFHRDLARARLAMLAEVESPLFLGPPTTRPSETPVPATTPTTEPATTLPSTVPVR